MLNVTWRGVVRETAGAARVNNKIYIHEFIDINDAWRQQLTLPDVS